MNILFLMDPLETVNPKKDTTLLLMYGAQNRHHRVFYLPKGGISLDDGDYKFRVVEVVPKPKKNPPFLIKKSVILTESEVDAIFVRTDPPFDEDYLAHTLVLERLPKSIVIWNTPSSIRSVNEKIWATQFKSLIPTTMITRFFDDYKTFLNREKDIIIKPSNSFGGAGIFRIKQGDVNANVAYEMVSENGKKDVILQSYIPEAEQGDKRVLLLDRNPLGAILRVHGKDDHRNNFFAGGKPVKTTLPERDLEIIKTLKPKLRARGLYFVGIDIIGDYLIEVNVTSPTCLQEMNIAYHQNLEEQIIIALEQHCKFAQENKTKHLQKGKDVTVS